MMSTGSTTVPRRPDREKSDNVALVGREQRTIDGSQAHRRSVVPEAPSCRTFPPTSSEALQ